MSNVIKFTDIPQLKGFGHHRYDIPLSQFKGNIENYIQEDSLDLCPDFQRGHVWTESQQIAFVEFVLRGGRCPEILFNHPGWMKSFEGEFVCVDGLQRITAFNLFLDNQLPIFNGYFKSNIEGIDRALRGIYISIYINVLPTRKDVLQWYLELNSGGTIHTQEELDRVKKLLKEI